MTIAEQVREACARTAEASESRDGAAARIRALDLTQFEPKAGEDVQVLLKRLRGAGETYTYLHEAADLIESLSARVAELEQDRPANDLLRPQT